ncbi:uncharacterized protein [Diabrotica undecimpunctata]|uniref:uncharacterized protein n=1 Tax=Diabrotica undecimpunctata TaxID=50387 RepID=UPI003B641EF6
MYRQILIKEEERSLQKIIWRSDHTNSLETNTLNTVTYGTASASFLATRCLQEVAHMYATDFPDISSIILREFYVDDLYTGCSTTEDIKRIQSFTSELLSRHGFQLRKWKSNAPILNFDNQNNVSLEIGADDTIKTLGLLWSPKSDTFHFNVQPIEHKCKVTKRLILSAISKIFDSLGLLSAVTITAKIILQDLWKLKISWDEVVPMDIFTKWVTYQTQLVKLNQLQIPRHVICRNYKSIQLHGFSDASTTAYGTCIYIRSSENFENFRCHLLCSITRVAPLKHILTVPRLELCGAYLLAELIDKVKQHMQLDLEVITYWCDSTIVLGWIKTSPSLLKTFVTNRVSQIQTLTESHTWRYVNTLENPADLLSGGISPTSLITSEMWFHGPSWLAKPETHWSNRTFEPSELPELRPASALIARVHMKLDSITKISSFVKLQRIIAYVLRFINNCKCSPKRRNFDNLSCEERDNALKYRFRLVQNETFYDDLTHLKRHGNVDSKSKLLTLNPFIDKDNILRVGGRLHNSDFCYDKKHPIVLDSKHHFTTILVRNEHLTLNHCSPQLLLASIREKF